MLKPIRAIISIKLELADPPDPAANERIFLEFIQSARDPQQAFRQRWFKSKIRNISFGTMMESAIILFPPFDFYYIWWLYT